MVEHCIEDAGVELDWIENHTADQHVPYLAILDALSGQKGFNIYCKPSETPDKQSSYYLNDADEKFMGCLADEGPFGVDVYKGPKTEEAAPEKKAITKQPASVLGGSDLKTSLSGAEEKAPERNSEVAEVAPSTDGDIADDDWD